MDLVRSVTRMTGCIIEGRNSNAHNGHERPVRSNLIMTARLSWTLVLSMILWVSLGLVGCSSDSPAPPPRFEPKPPAVAKKARDPRPAIVVLGDSLTAGFGLESGSSYPDLLQKMLDEKGYMYRVVNQGLSGDTTTGGLARVGDCLAEKPQIVVVALGGNDGLRGIPTANTRANLGGIIERVQSSGAEVVLAGITLPRNYGDDYIRDFDRIFPELAKQYHVPLIPFLLAGLASPAGLVPGMLQPDGIHPTAKGTPIIARTVMAKLEPLLKAK
jgi:acyl-CoA thioesterase-1